MPISALVLPTDTRCNRGQRPYANTNISIYGPVGGALLLSVLTESLRAFSEYRLWVYTPVLIFILFFMPQGLIAPLWRRIRSFAV
jgi:branched-chain amino acid transport system permease protein